MNLFIIMLSIVLTIWGIAYFIEFKRWNHGKCPICNMHWKYFDTDSQGGRGYKCSCKRVIWISWPFLDKKEK
jgi:hypothetical protein